MDFTYEGTCIATMQINIEYIFRTLEVSHMLFAWHDL